MIINLLSIELIRNNNILTKNIELEFNEKLNKYLIGISSSDKP